MTARTTRRLLVSVALGAFFAAPWLHSPAARADSGDFLNRIQQLGWYDDRGDTYLLDNGFLVCRLMDRGYNGVQVAESIYVNTGVDVSADDAAEFVIIAVEELCPRHDHRGEGSLA